MKRCSKCGEEKSLDMFSKDKNRSDGLYTYCKECSRKDSKKYYDANAEKIKANSRKWCLIYKTKNEVAETKYCPKCQTIKEASYFDKDKSQKTGLCGWCRECRKIKWLDNIDENLGKKRLGYKKHREKNLAYAHQYTKDNKDIIAEKHREYMKRPDVKSAVRNYCKNRRDTDPMLRLNNATRSAIHHSLRGNKKGLHWETLVDFTIDQLKGHLEKLFKPGMTWENYGKDGWEIDHKTPLAAHNFSSHDQLDFKRAWALDNLQPLWASENRAKNDKIDRPFQPALALAV